MHSTVCGQCHSECYSSTMCFCCLSAVAYRSFHLYQYNELLHIIIFVCNIFVYIKFIILSLNFSLVWCVLDLYTLHTYVQLQCGCILLRSISSQPAARSDDSSGRQQLGAIAARSDSSSEWRQLGATATLSDGSSEWRQLGATVARSIYSCIVLFHFSLFSFSPRIVSVIFLPLSWSVILSTLACNSDACSFRLP